MVGGNKLKYKYESYNNMLLRNNCIYNSYKEQHEEAIDRHNERLRNQQLK